VAKPNGLSYPQKTAESQEVSGGLFDNNVCNALIKATVNVLS